MNMMRVAIGIIIGLTIGAVSISPNALAQGPASAPLGSPIGEMLVADSVGKVLGRVAGEPDPVYHQSILVAIPFNREWFFLRLERRNRLRPINMYFLQFASSDCTGPPLILSHTYPPDESMIPLVTVSRDNKIYRQNGSSELTYLFSGEEEDENGNLKCSVFSGPHFDPAAPAQPVFDLNVFTPPFSVIRR